VLTRYILAAGRPDVLWQDAPASAIPAPAFRDNPVVDGHTALDSSVIGKAQADNLEVVLVRLVHGRYDVEYTIHVAPTSSLNYSGRLVAPDVLAQLKLPLAQCKFTSAGVCAWQQVPEETSVDAYASTMSKAIKQLSDADSTLLQSMCLELPKPESGGMRRDWYLGHLGDGHRGQEIKRFDDPPPDDDRSVIGSLI